MKTFEHILLPIDFGDAMDASIDVAVSLAKPLNARITLLTVFDVRRFATGAAFDPPVETTPLIEGIERDLRAVLDRVRPLCTRCAAELRRGPVDEVIVAAASDLHADLIVLGTHGRSGMARVILGSVAESVLRSAPVPVVTVRPRGA